MGSLVARQQAEGAERDDGDGDKCGGCPGCAGADRSDPQFAHQRPVAGQVATHEQYGAVLQKGSKLLPLVNTTLAGLIKNGTVGKLQTKWFNLDFSKIPTLK